MNTIQLDECMNSKRLIKRCATEAKIATLPFPKEFEGRGIKDPEMLQWWNALGVMLLTCDERMAEDHMRFFPNQHKGIVVVCNGSYDILNHSVMMMLFADFKSQLPEWDRLQPDNVIIELWHNHPTRNVCVFRLLDGELAWQESFSYSDPGWKQKFLQSLERAKNHRLLTDPHAN